MGFIWRRIVGFVAFGFTTIVLTAIAARTGSFAGDPVAGAACGVSIFVIAVLASFTVRRAMKWRTRRRR